MKRNGKLFWAKTAVILGVVPVLLWAYEYGPDVGYSGVPTDNGGATCASSGCHVGTANSGKGSVTVNFPNGMTYTPGVAQQLSVTVADPATTQKAWGFQLTARLASSTSTQEGSFTSADANTQVLCSDSSLDNNRQKLLSFGVSQTCPTNQPLSFMEHSQTGYNSSFGKTGSYTFNFTWTPPATNVGNITLFVAGNAADGQLNDTGDHIYNTKFTLTPAAAGNPPVITSINTTASGVLQISQNGWIEIHGSNLSQVTDTWGSLPASAFAGTLPTTLDNISATVDGKPAAIFYVSSTQVNILPPIDSALGTVTVQLNTPNGTASKTVTEAASTPALFVIDGAAGHVAAEHLNYSYLGPPSLNAPGYTFTPAAPGETVVLYGTGFGQTSPAFANEATAGGSQLAVKPSIAIGGVPAVVSFAGISGAGLYQFNVVVPSGTPNGDATLSALYNGTSTQANVFITVHN